MAQEKPTFIRPDDPADVGKIAKFDGTNIVWVSPPVGSVISASAPSSPTSGTLWFNSTTGVLSINTGTPQSPVWVADTAHLGTIGSAAAASTTTLLARANHTGTQSADTVVDGTTNKAYTATEKTKLAGIATGATANSTDAYLLNRANHTGTAADPAVAVSATAPTGASNGTLWYDPDTGVLALNDGTVEAPVWVEPIAGLPELGSAALVDTGTLLARANHTGTQSADTVVDGTTNKAYTATEKTKLAGIATGATANSTDAYLLSRANHTGTLSVAATNLTSDARALQVMVGYRKAPTVAEVAGTTAAARIYNRSGRTWTITGWHASADVAPVGSVLTVTVWRNDSNVGAVSFNVAAAANTGTSTTSMTVNNGDFVQMWVTAVGSTTPGSEIVVVASGTWA